MKKEMLINVLQPEECRIAIVEDGLLEELYVERTSHESYVGNIYKGRIVNIEPSIQAAFVDFGVGRNGFLHVSDVEPQYYRHKLEGGNGSDRRGARSRDQLPDILELPDVPVATEMPDDLDDEEDDQTFAEVLTERSDEATDDETDEEIVNDLDDSDEEETELADEGEALGADEDEDDRPRRMPSAERRTEDEGGNGGSPPISVEPVEDVLFSRPKKAQAASKPVALAAPPAPPPPRPAPPREEREPTSAPQEKEEARAPREDEPRGPGEEEPRGQRREKSRGRGRAEGKRGRRREEGPAARHRDDVPPADPDVLGEPDGELDVMQLGDEGEGEGSDRQRRGRGRGRPRRMGGGRDRGLGRQKPPIQEIFRRGQEVLVQVIKEGIGTKGPTLSTYISIPGRYLVLMPGLNRIGVSRKIIDDEHRRRLRDILGELEPPKGLGFIIRTAGLDRTKKELQRDLAYLTRLWKVVVRRIKKLKAPASIYQESDMITRTIRDVFTSEIDTIWVDEAKAFEHAQEFLQIVMPRYAQRIKHYDTSEPLFHKYGIEEEINRIQRRRVPLPHGGSLVIDQTEALVAIDVNSGNFRADNNAEETAYRINLQAAKEIARQLRLRDLGGVIVNDFIDMREERHRRDVEKALRDAIKRDRARTKLLRMSQFGIIEMTRQRIRPSLKRSVYEDCPACSATGQVKTTESMSIEVMRLLQLASHRNDIVRIHVVVADPVAQYLHNKKRREISGLEETGKLTVSILGKAGALPETLDIACHDANGSEVKLLPGDTVTPERTRPRGGER